MFYSCNNGSYSAVAKAFESFNIKLFHIYRCLPLGLCYKDFACLSHRTCGGFQSGQGLLPAQNSQSHRKPQCLCRSLRDLCPLQKSRPAQGEKRCFFADLFDLFKNLVNFQAFQPLFNPDLALL